MVEIKSKTELYAGDANIRKKWRRRTSNEKPEWIVIHYTGDASVNGDADHAARSIISSSRDSSTHYLIGDRYIINLLPVKYAAYHVGKMDDKKLIPCYNGNAIAVDLCESKENTSSDSVSCTDWFFKDSVIDNAVNFVASLAVNYSIPSDKIVRHYDVTHKRCPRPFVGKDINSHTGKTHDSAWLEFKRRIDEKITEIKSKATVVR